MEFYKIPILFGNNIDTLFGVKNDVYIIYNLFYKFFLKYPNLYHKPYIFLNEKSLLSNIKDIIINNNIKAKIIFIIYFSGHSSSKGHLKFYDYNVSANMLLNYINNHLTYSSQIYFIIDSCYSKNFILNINNNYNYIEKIYFMGSCMEYEQSKEIETEYDIKLFKYKNIEYNETDNERCNKIDNEMGNKIDNEIDNKMGNKIVVGIFSLYLVKLVMVRKINDIIDFKNIINDKLWKMISNKYKQTLYYEEL
jgi:hypothetical protein